MARARISTPSLTEVRHRRHINLTISDAARIALATVASKCGLTQSRLVERLILAASAETPRDPP